MHPLERIFVAIDFGTASDEALRQAHQRALSTGARLAVCHIIPSQLRSNPLFPQFNRAAAVKVPLEVDRAAEAVSNRVAEITGRTGEHVTIMVDHGSPHAELLKAAEQWNASLIVLGSHGMTSTTGIFLGSVGHKIIQCAHSTVLVARPSNREGGIVAGTDFSDPALPAISAAIDEASRTKRPLTIVHSLELGFSMASPGAIALGELPPIVSGEDFAAMQHNARERLLEALRSFEADAEALVTTGPAGLALITAAKERNANLLVVGTTGLTGLSRILLGSVAEEVASKAPCSVLITRLHR